MYLPLRFTLIILFSLQLSILSTLASATSLQAVEELDQTIEQKQLRLNKFQQQLIRLNKENRAVQSDVQSVNVDLKQLKHQAHKLEAMSSSPSSAADKKQLSTITYKRRVAEIAQDKNTRNADRIAKEEKRTKQSIDRLNSLLISLNKEKLALEEEYANSKEAQATAKKEARAQKLATKRLKQQQRKMRQQQAAAKKKRQAKQKKNQIEKKQQLEKQKKEQQQQAETTMLLKKIAGLPQDEAALIRAQHIAQQTPTSGPALGNNPLLKVANPIGSKPKTLVKMQHLGNHQYSATIQVKKGRQQYIIGKHTFNKSISKQFNGLTCLILIDAREEQPIFQLIAKGRR